MDAQFFELLLALAVIVAGAIASRFGIGSVLTPLLALEVGTIWVTLVVMTVGVVVGPVFGRRVLERIPEFTFRRVVAVLIRARGEYVPDDGPLRLRTHAVVII